MKTIRNLAFVVLATCAALAQQTAPVAANEICDYQGCGSLEMWCENSCYAPEIGFLGMDESNSYCYGAMDPYDEPWDCIHCECEIVR